MIRINRGSTWRVAAADIVCTLGKRRWGPPPSPRDAFGSQMVLVQNDAGYWNATSMAVQGGRTWKDYCKSQRARDFVTRYAAELGVPESELVHYEQPRGKGQGGTTWVRRRIALHFLGDLSAGFANWAFGVIERYIDGEITTEESQAAKKAVDALLEEGRIKYEQSQKQPQAAQVDLKFAEGRQLEAEANSKKFWRQVDQATAETDDLKKQLGLKRQTAVKRKRMQDGKHFLQEVSRAIMEYRDGVPGPWPEVEDRLEISMPEFLEYLKSHTSSYNWVGQDLSRFGELPAVKDNPKQWNVALFNRDDGDLHHKNIVAAANPDSRGKMWQDCC